MVNVLLAGGIAMACGPARNQAFIRFLVRRGYGQSSVTTSPSTTSSGESPPWAAP